MIDKITQLYYDLRNVERGGRSRSELCSLIGRVFDLLFIFVHQFALVARVHPDFQRFEKPILEHMSKVNDCLFENIEFSSEESVEVKRIAALINQELAILVPRLNALKEAKR